MPLAVDASLLGREFDVTEHGAVGEQELLAFAHALGATEPEYTQPGPALVAHPTFCVRYRGQRFYPEGFPTKLDWRRGFDAGRDIELGVPIRPGDAITVRSTLHEVYEKTGRSGSMVFVVVRFTLENQRGERVAVIDNRFMHR